MYEMTGAAIDLVPSKVLRQAEPSVATAGKTKTQSAVGNVHQAKQLLAEAVSQITTDTPTASAIKSKMLALDPTFDENRYGYSNFRDLLADVGGAKIVGRSGGDITVSVPSD